VNRRVGVVRGRIAVGKNSCTIPIKHWSSLVGVLGDQDDRVHLIGGENLALFCVVLRNFRCSSTQSYVLKRLKENRLGV